MISWYLSDKGRFYDWFSRHFHDGRRDPLRGVPRGHGEDPGALRGRVLLLLPSILQKNHAEGGAGKVQISGKISVVRDYF